MIQREWIRVSRIDQAVADIHEVLEPLADQRCVKAPASDAPASKLPYSDCGECPSCRARAALNMLDLEIVSAVGVRKAQKPEG